MCEVGGVVRGQGGGRRDCVGVMFVLGGVCGMVITQSFCILYHVALILP